MGNCLPLFFSASHIDLIGEDNDEYMPLKCTVPENHQQEAQIDVPPRICAPQRPGLPSAYTGPPPPTFASSPFGTSTPSTMSASSSSDVFGAAQASSPFSSNTTFGASSPGFWNSTPAFGASSSPAFGSSVSPFEAFGQSSSSSPFGFEPVFGQTNNMSNNLFAPNPFGTFTPFGAQTRSSIFASPATGVFGAPQASSPFSFSKTFEASSPSTRGFGSSTPAFGTFSSPALIASSASHFPEPRRMEFGYNYKPVNSQNDVVARVAKHVMSTIAKGSNLVFSPTSINVLLGLVAAGANDVTKHQILSFLKSPSADHLCLALAAMADQQERTDSCLCVANGVWIHKQVSLKSSFKELLENSYKATCRQADFASKPLEVVDEVNAWADENTKGLIKQLLSKDLFIVETIRVSKLILANAIYFKGSWQQKFEANLTKDEDFHLLDGNTVKVPFMSNRKNQYLSSYDDFQVLKLPYVEDHRRFSMYIYLPNDKDGLQALLERMVSENGFLDNHIPERRIKVDAFKIPKFKISYGFEVSKILKEMGLTSPFEGGLTEMINVKSSSIDEEPRVSSILHKAFIEVDEKGTEAAAVTTGLCFGCGFNPHREEVRFVADHPFMFTIREDKSGVVLFMGQVLNPSN